MRVIAGSVKGRKLVAPQGMGTRPTPARVREALFSILAGYVAWDGAAVLDLYAGSGALGVEALSRGAARGVFVERDRRALTALRINLTPFAKTAHVLAMPAQAALAQLARRPHPFDVVFLDPPYGANLLQESLNNVAQGGFVGSAGVVVCEHHSQTQAPTAPPTLTHLRSRAFGDVTISLFGAAEGLAA